MSKPKVYGFINGGGGDMLIVSGLAEDGTPLAGHCSSSMGWAEHDIDVFKRETYAKHYPDGYEFEWVPVDQITTHPGLTAAIEKANARAPAESEQPSSVSTPEEPK